MEIANKIIALAKKQVGVKETSNNWSTQISKYLAAVNINFPAAWCMALMVWVNKNIGYTSALATTGGVLDQWNKTPNKYRTSTPAPGYIFIIDHGKGKGHAGVVIAVQDKDTINTIEGNTNNDGSRNGNICLERSRMRKSVNVGYINLPQMIADKNKVNVLSGVAVSFIAAVLFFF
jgi:hypothetical protein